jgi:guanylate kinase
MLSQEKGSMTNRPVDEVPAEQMASTRDEGEGPGDNDLPEAVQQIVAAAGPAPEFDRYVRRPEPSLLVVLTGPSGVGKDVTLQRMKERDIPFHYVVTATTRARRPGEVEGLHYHFKSREEFQRMLSENALIEHAEVYGNYYGIPREEVIGPLKQGHDVIMKPDVQGARTMRQIEPEAVYIFLAPPSMEELASRLYHRKTEDPQEFARRLSVAREEMHALSDFDYVVVNKNGELDDTVDAIEAIIQAEKRRVRPRRLRLLEWDEGRGTRA